MSSILVEGVHNVVDFGAGCAQCRRFWLRVCIMSSVLAEGVHNVAGFG